MVIKENSNKMVVFTEQFDYKNRQIIVPIEINTNSEYNTLEVQDVNVLKSMHGRSSIFNYLNNLLNKSSDIIYRNKKKIQKLSDNRKVQYPEAISPVSTNNIPQNEQKVNNGISTNSNMQNNEKNTQKETAKEVKKAIDTIKKQITQPYIAQRVSIRHKSHLFLIIYHKMNKKYIFIYLILYF